MKVCVVGSGGREHALAHVLARTAEVVVTPGNPGIPGSVPTPPEEIDADLFVIGPGRRSSMGSLTGSAPPDAPCSVQGPTVPASKGRRRG